ncbi:hypothetical protein V9T40_000195 [Parthenolecanium corni]|uniref:Uncharacterized protein n=1 Tax=Parthenolecanium corni TaxID=536013 RepID=A0AAN9Y039_9HEMI
MGELALFRKAEIASRSRIKYSSSFDFVRRKLALETAYTHRPVLAAQRRNERAHVPSTVDSPRVPSGDGKVWRLGTLSLSFCVFLCNESGTLKIAISVDPHRPSSLRRYLNTSWPEGYVRPSRAEPSRVAPVIANSQWQSAIGNRQWRYRMQLRSNVHESRNYEYLWSAHLTPYFCAIGLKLIATPFYVCVEKARQKSSVQKYELYARARNTPWGENLSALRAPRPSKCERVVFAVAAAWRDSSSTHRRDASFVSIFAFRPTRSEAKRSEATRRLSRPQARAAGCVAAHSLRV